MENDASPEHDAASSRLPTADVEACYGRYADELRRFLTAVLRHEAVAQDIVQSVFVKFSERGGEVDPGRWKAWLFQVAYRDALQWRRRQQTGSRATEAAFWLQPRATPEAPDDRAERSEEVERVRQALEQLPSRERSVVKLRIYHGMTFSQIAQELDAPLGTVLGRMRSALGRLRRLLDEPE